MVVVGLVGLAGLGAEWVLNLDAREQMTLFADALVIFEAASTAFSIGASLHALVVPNAVLVGRAIDVLLAYSVSQVLAWPASEQVAVLGRTLAAGDAKGAVFVPFLADPKWIRKVTFAVLAGRAVAVHQAFVDCSEQQGTVHDSGF